MVRSESRRASVWAATRIDLENIQSWTVEAIDAQLRAVSDRLDKKLRVMTPPRYVAISGSSRSLPLFDSMSLLGRSVVRERLKRAASVVGSMVSAS